MFSKKPNLKNKFKSAGEEIDKMLNIWILLIHKEYISTFTKFQAAKFLATAANIPEFRRRSTGNPGSVIVPQYGSSKITVFLWGKNTILKFLGNTK